MHDRQYLLGPARAHEVGVLVVDPRRAAPHAHRRHRLVTGSELILDCKYYQEVLVSHYDALRFRSGNLYQLNAYLTNKAAAPGWEEVEGMLLYPSNGYELDHRSTHHGRHRVSIRTIDLQQPWTTVESSLLEVFVPVLSIPL